LTKDLPRVFAGLRRAEKASGSALMFYTGSRYVLLLASLCVGLLAVSAFAKEAWNGLKISVGEMGDPD
jgi:hypothetical protein